MLARARYVASRLSRATGITLLEQKYEAPPAEVARRIDPLRHARRLAVLVIGGTVLAIGGIMLLTPGPGMVGILLGLSILGTEFAWARRLLRRARETAQNTWDGLRNGGSSPSDRSD